MKLLNEKEILFSYVATNYHTRGKQENIFRKSHCVNVFQHIQEKSFLTIFLQCFVYLKPNVSSPCHVVDASADIHAQFYFRKIKMESTVASENIKIKLKIHYHYCCFGEKQKHH